MREGIYVKQWAHSRYLINAHCTPWQRAQKAGRRREASREERRREKNL